jgi:hypothetical protein
MISSGREWIRDVREDRFSIVINLGGFSMDGRGRVNDEPSIGICDALMPQANSQNGNPAPEVPHYLVGNPTILRGARARRNDNRAGGQSLDFGRGYLIVAIDRRLPPKLPDILGQIIDKRVVVIND